MDWELWQTLMRIAVGLGILLGLVWVVVDLVEAFGGHAATRRH